MGGDAGERGRRVRQRQEIVEEGAVVGRPGKMLGKGCRPVAVDQRLQPGKMRLVEWALPPDRQADAVQRKRIVLSDRGEIAVWRPAVAHVVFGVHLEEADIGLAVEDFAIMLRLQAEACARRKHAAELHADHPSLLFGKAGRPRSPRRGTQEAFGSSEPLCPSTSMVVQVPAGTAFQALPW